MRGAGRCCPLVARHAPRASRAPGPAPRLTTARGRISAARAPRPNGRRRALSRPLVAPQGRRSGRCDLARGTRGDHGRGAGRGTHAGVSGPGVSGAGVSGPGVSGPDVSRPDVSRPDVSRPGSSSPGGSGAGGCASRWHAAGVLPGARCPAADARRRRRTGPRRRLRPLRRARRRARGEERGAEEALRRSALQRDGRPRHLYRRLRPARPAAAGHAAPARAVEPARLVRRRGPRRNPHGRHIGGRSRCRTKRRARVRHSMRRPPTRQSRPASRPLARESLLP